MAFPAPSGCGRCPASPASDGSQPQVSGVPVRSEAVRLPLPGVPCSFCLSAGRSVSAVNLFQSVLLGVRLASWVIFTRFGEFGAIVSADMLPVFFLLLGHPPTRAGVRRCPSGCCVSPAIFTSAGSSPRLRPTLQPPPGISDLRRYTFQLQGFDVGGVTSVSAPVLWAVRHRRPVLRTSLEAVILL